MDIKRLQDLVEHAKQVPQASRVAVVDAHDIHTLESVVSAARERVIVPILIGDKGRIESLLTELGENPKDYQIIASPDTIGSLAEMVKLINSGEADVIMKGKLETGTLMKAVVSKENNLFQGKLISLLGVYEVPKYHKLLYVSDMGINTYPDLAGKEQILRNAVTTLHHLGIICPKVAVLAAVEKVNPRMPDTVDADALKKMNTDGSIDGCLVEGPIAFDLAVSKEAAITKGFISPVAGDVDLLLVPDIVVGNVLVKCLSEFAGAKIAGTVVGARVPIILTSRSASAADKYASIALAACATSR